MSFENPFCKRFHFRLHCADIFGGYYVFVIFGTNWLSKEPKES